MCISIPFGVCAVQLHYKRTKVMDYCYFLYHDDHRDDDFVLLYGNTSKSIMKIDDKKKI